MHYRVTEYEVSPRSETDVVELPDGADIVASEYRNPNRLVLAVAIPVEQCIAETASGDRCQNDAVNGAPVCGIHMD